MTDGIIILDFGSRYNQLIARVIRDSGVYSEVLPFNTPLQQIADRKPKGIILAGGTDSVSDEDSNSIDKKVFELGVPVLGIGYGMQLIARLFGAELSKGEDGGYAEFDFHHKAISPLFAGVPAESNVWTGDFNTVKEVPEGFELLGQIGDKISAISHKQKQIYAVQFHPEISHTEYGDKILDNFVFDICQAERNWTMKEFISSQIKEIKEKVGDKKVILGLSGGVDSSVSAVLIHEAIGDQLTCIFVDTGLLRKDEGKKVFEKYGEHFDINIEMVDASKQFLSQLEGVTDPEEKRKIIGREFVEVFYAQAKKHGDADFLAQGTIYPDVIESQAVKGKSGPIKSHHNVGGLPEDMKLELLEPLRELFKDEVRRVGVELGIDPVLVNRHPFPGPGLGVRMPGEITEEKIKILQEADDIFIDELYKNNLYNEVSQAFVVLLPVKSVGVKDGKRTYEYTAVVRSVNTIDFMTATWSKFPYEFLEKVSSRIIKEVNGINRVLFDISSKPPATIEWE